MTVSMLKLKIKLQSLSKRKKQTFSSYRACQNEKKKVLYIITIATSHLLL